METFSDFKKYFYAKITDFSLFDCGDINLLKIVLDGLRVNYKDESKINNDFLMNPFIYDCKYFLKRLKSKLKGNNKKGIDEKLEKCKNRILIGFSERSHKNGENGKSVYFERIFNLLGREKIVFVGESKLNEIKDVDFRLQDLITVYSELPLNNTERQFLKKLKNVFYRIEASQIFSKNELNSISNAFEVFFLHYKAWNKVFELLKPSIAIFDQHYHREGFVFSCKQNSIKTIELQHGLIVPEDIFYVFPKETSKVVDRALFADQILVYGDYWKDNLLKGAEYSVDKITNIGFYHYEPIVNVADEDFLKFSENANLILITTQVNISKSYCEYIKVLSGLINRKNYNWKIIVKIHPSEKMEDYSEVSNLENCRVVQYPVNYLFTISKIHISIYSTTLFDAHRFNIYNFTLSDEKYKDYCQRIAADNIAIPLNVSDDPIEMYLKRDNEYIIKKDYLYEDFNEKILINIIEPK